MIFLFFFFSAPEDFIADIKRDVLFASDKNQLCIEFEIVDDQIALEGDEDFKVTFEINSGNTTALPGDTSDSTVTIEDNDCKIKIKI